MVESDVDPVAEKHRGEFEWEIYELGSTYTYGWSWRCKDAGLIARQCAIAYTDIRDAISDAIAHGMSCSRHKCEIVRADDSRMLLDGTIRLSVAEWRS